VEPGFIGKGKPGEALTIDYKADGADTGYS
jgi:hypothetical protein